MDKVHSASAASRGEGGVFASEERRKLIHIASSAVPMSVWWMERPLAIALLGILTLTALLVEWARLQVRWARYHFLARTRALLRGHERRRPAGATYMAIGYFAAFLLFPLPVAVSAMLYNALGDASAAVIGRRWGRHRTRWGKSWEGAVSGFVVNLSIGWIVPGISPTAAAVGGLGAAVLEFLPLPVDDNLRVTLGGGSILWLLTVLAV